MPEPFNPRDIASRLGLTRYARSWRGRCPACDYAGTFSVRAGRDGRALADAVARATGQEHQPARQDDGDAAAVRQRKQDAALRLWRGSEPATGTAADAYLTRRGLTGLAASPALRFRGDTPHPEGGKRLAMVCDVSGEPIAVHRTYIMRDGSKAAVQPAKASLGPVRGGAIRLAELVADAPLVIGEGIESAASAGRLMGWPAWAAISAGNMAKGLVLPSEVRGVVIAADPDPVGRIAARDAWLRWRAEGRAVQIATPDGTGDFNDLLCAPEAGRV
jgi:putative DNA primase/helicase